MRREAIGVPLRGRVVRQVNFRGREVSFHSRSPIEDFFDLVSGEGNDKVLFELVEPAPNSLPFAVPSNWEEYMPNHVYTDGYFRGVYPNGGFLLIDGASYLAFGRKYKIETGSVVFLEARYKIQTAIDTNRLVSIAEQRDWKEIAFRQGGRELLLFHPRAVNG